MSSWTHKDHAIEMVGANFVTNIGGKRIAVGSLSAAKKSIDKHLEKKALEVELKLPVVMLVANRRYDQKKGERGVVVSAVITGVDPDSMEVNGIDTPSNKRREYVMPDTPENAKLLRDLDAAEIEYEKLKSKVNGRIVPTYFSGFGRNKPSYAEAIQKLQAGYAAAQKSDA